MKRTKKRSALRTLALLLVCAFLLQCLPLVIAEDSSALPPAPSEEIALPDMVASLMAADGETYLQRAYDQEQSLNDVVLQTNGRTYVSYIFNDPVKYTDATGTHDKDTTLIAATGGYRQKANDIQSFLPTHVTSGVTYSADGYSVKFTPSAAQNVVVAPIAVTNNGYGENHALYQRVFGENTALKYTPYYNSLKEEIVLNAYTGQTAFSFLYETNGLSFSDTENGLFLVNSEGETVFTFPELIAYDSNGKQAECSYAIETAKAGAIYLFTVSVPQAFLTAEDTVYPVYVDPTVTFSNSSSSTVIEDTTIYYGQPSAIGSTRTHVHTGIFNTYDETAYALFRFPGIVGNSTYRNIIKNPRQIRYAELGLYNVSSSYNEFSYGSIGITLYDVSIDWSESTATYNNLSSYIYREEERGYFSVSENGGTFQSGVGTGNWFLVNILPALEPMCRDSVASYGIALEAYTDYNTVAFHSTEASSNTPFVKLEYFATPLPETQTPGIVSGAIYTFINSKTDANGFSIALTTAMEGAEDESLIGANYNASSANQKFRVVYKGNGKYVLRNQSDYNMIIGITGIGRVVERLNGVPDTLWYIVPVSATNVSAGYYLVNAGNTNAQINFPTLTAGDLVLHEREINYAIWIPQMRSTTDEQRYALFTQDDPTEGSTWDGTNLLTLKPSSSSASFLTRIDNDGCVIASFAMMLNNYDVWVPYDCDDPRTTTVERFDVPVDPFTATLANCIDTDETMPEAWPTFVNNVMSPSDSFPCSLKDNGSRLETVFGVNLVFLNSTSSSLNTAQKVAAKLNELLIEHPEGVVAYFKREINGVTQAHALVFLKSNYDPELHETESSIVEQLYCYDPIQLPGNNDGDGTELLKYKNSYTYSYEDTDEPAKTTKYQFSELLWLAYVEH